MNKQLLNIGRFLWGFFIVFIFSVVFWFLSAVLKSLTIWVWGLGILAYMIFSWKKKDRTFFAGLVSGLLFTIVLWFYIGLLIGGLFDHPSWPEPCSNEENCWSWPVVKGKIEKMNLYKADAPHKGSLSIEAVYSLPDKHYSGRVYTILYLSDWNDADKIAAKYSVGSIIDVHYDSNNPERSFVIAPRGSLINWGFIENAPISRSKGPT